MDQDGELRLLLAPALIAAATLVGRRFGPRHAGWFVRLPLTSGPVIYLLALADGAVFAAGAAQGAPEGLLAEIVFLLARALRAKRWPWSAALLPATTVFAAVAGIYNLQQPAPAALA